MSSITTVMDNLWQVLMVCYEFCGLWGGLLEYKVSVYMGCSLISFISNHKEEDGMSNKELTLL